MFPSKNFKSFLKIKNQHEKIYQPYFLEYSLVLIKAVCVNYKNNDLKKVPNNYIYGKVSKRISLNTKTFF
jgi:hypothetical protein